MIPIKDIVYRIKTNPKPCSRLCKEVCSCCKIDSNGKWTGRTFEDKDKTILYEFEYKNLEDRNVYSILTSSNIYES